MFNRLYGWYGKKTVRVVIAVVVVLLATGIFVKEKGEKKETELKNSDMPTVTIRAVGDLKSESSWSVVGSVRSISESRLQSEASGRVTSMRVQLGDRVSSGAVIATIENAREQAQLLQAQGTYESAVASSKSNTVNLEEAKVAAQQLYRDSYTVAENSIKNLADEFYVRPGTSLSGFLLSHGNPRLFNSRRSDLETLLSDWSSSIKNGHPGLSDGELIEKTETYIKTVNDYMADLYVAVSRESETDNRYTEAELSSYKTRISGARSALQGVLSSVSQTRRSLEQAKLGGEKTGVSQSEAALKSALGVLRNAEVSYQKTIIRSPLTGVVNALYINEGDYVQMGTPVALVANNGSLEISTFVSEGEAMNIQEGDQVSINHATHGTVIAIAPAVDPGTGKIEVKIGAKEDGLLKNGSTATVTFTRNETIASTDQTIVVPLKSVKLLPSGPVAFTVKDNILVSVPLTLGKIVGDSVEVTDGLTKEDFIIVDARGRKDGESVTVTQN